MGADAARFYTIGGAILYCATPPYTTVGADAARFFLRLAARSPTVLPPGYTTVGADASRFYTVDGAILYCANPRYTIVGTDAARF